MLKNWLIYILKWKIYVGQRFNKKNDKMLKGETTTVDNYTYVNYYVILNDKEYEIFFVSNSNLILYNDIVSFQKNKTSNIDKRNWIVHASIVDSNSDVLFDVTNDFRKFCYYFGSEMSLNVFYKWFQHKINTEYAAHKPNINIYDYSMTLFMNDDQFSERTFKISDSDLINFNKTNVM